MGPVVDQWQAYRALAAELGDPQLAETVASVRPQAGLKQLSCCYMLLQPAKTWGVFGPAELC
jgi:hypothetical protein